MSKNTTIIIVAIAIILVGSGVTLYTISSMIDTSDENQTQPEPIVTPTEPEIDTTTESHRTGNTSETITDSKLVKFATFNEYKEFLDEFDELRTSSQFGYVDPRLRFAQPEVSMALDESFGSAPSSSPTHSTTNVQVKGVDEADFVKNDDRHIYTLKHNLLTIVDTQEITTKSGVFSIELDIPPLVQKYDMFVNGDRLVVLYYIADYNQAGFIDDYTTHALVLDITDRMSAEYILEYTITGKIHTARMIGDDVYVVASKIPNPEHPVQPFLKLDDQIIQRVPIYHFEDIELPNLTTMMAFDVTGNASNSLSFVIDETGSTFMSKENLYITSITDNSDSAVSLNLVVKLLDSILELYPEQIKSELTASLQDIDPKDENAPRMALELFDNAFSDLPDSVRGSAMVGGIIEQLDVIDNLIEDSETTTIYKVAIDGVDFELAANGSVPGRLINQFAMDEHEGKLRVATTVNKWADAFNNVFVLDDKLDELGALVGIAHDEEIYSARFVDDKLYLVTFRQIDPFFVIDLSTDSPRIDGKLKLPGYSDYLHFYDKNTVIGIGRDEGVKIAVFDISDMRHPRLADSVVIGSWGTSSPVEQDHKAVLIDRTKSLLVLPIFSYSEVAISNTIDDTKETIIELDEQGSFVFMVFDITLSGLELEHTISHESYKEQDHTYWQDRTHARSLYIDDNLYTVSESQITKSPLSEPFHTLDIPIGTSED